MIFNTGDQISENLTETFDDSLAHLQATTIEGVITSLDKIVEWSKTNQHRAGYFAALYRKVTIKVKEGIESGKFDDADRMEKLDVIFANRYLEAFEQFYCKKSMTQSWQLAFDLSEKWSPIVLQHLMIGMNAHINLDLGIAAAQTTSKDRLSDLKNDFDKINTLLASLVNEIQDELGQIWPIFKLIDKLAGSADEALADFSMKLARNQAWELALEYANEPNEQKADVIRQTDCKMYLLGQFLAKPSLRLRLILLLVRLGERQGVKRIIEIMS